LLKTLAPSEKNKRFPIESEIFTDEGPLYITPFGITRGDPELKVTPVPGNDHPKYQLLNSPWENK
jgi:hypothetical protein